MPKKPHNLNWASSSQEERDQWYRDYEVQCLGDEGNMADRCGYLKRKYKEWNIGNPYILDFPCHDGFVTRGFLGNGASILGFDIGIDAIKMSNEVAEQRYPKDKGFEWDYILSSIKEFDWTSYEGAFDIVVCFEFIEHILRKDVDELLTLMDIVTKPGGYVAISTPQKSGKYGDSDENGSHINIYTADDLKKQIAQSINVKPEVEETEDFIFVSWRKS